VKLALWSPHPHAGGLGAVVPWLEREATLALCTGPGAVPAADLHLFHVDDTLDHAYVLEALRDRPGVVLLAEWNLHRVAREEALSRGGRQAYLREVRRSHGEPGVFAARQHARNREGAMLRSLFPLNDRVLEASLGLVAFTRTIATRARARLPGRPAAHVPLDLAAARHEPLERETSRRTASLDPAEAVVAAVRPRGEAHSGQTAHALADLAGSGRVTVRWTHADDPDGEPLVAAADVVVALEHPVRGGLDPLVVAAMSAARPVLVTAGGAAAREFGEGIVIPVSPGRTEAGEVAALVGRLLGDGGLRARIGELARRHVVDNGDPETLAARLLQVVHAVAADLEASLAAWRAERPEEGTLAAMAIEEVRWGARDLGLVGLPLDLGAVLGGLFEREAE